MCLAPLAVDQLTAEPGNLRLIAHSIRHPVGEAMGARQAAAVAAGHLSPLGTWITGDDAIDPLLAAAAGRNPLLLILPVLAVAVAGAMAWRAGAGDAVSFLAVTATAAAAGLFAAARTTGIPYFYLFTWFRPIAVLLWVAVIWAVIRVAGERGWLAGRRPAWGHVAVAAGAVATAVASVAALFSGPGLTLADEVSSESLQVMTPALVAAVGDEPRVDLTMAGGFCDGELGHGLGLQLVEHGIDVAVGPDLRTAYGPPRVGRGERPRVELICGDGAAELARRSPTALVATVNPVTDAERAELRALQDHMRATLQAAGRDDLVPVADTPGLVAIARDGDGTIAGVPIEARDLARMGVLLEKGRRSAALFYHPAPPAEQVQLAGTG